MKEHLIYFKNFLLTFFTNLIELSSNVTIKKIKNSWQELLDKIKNFKETNWNLALYHWKANNINDAIMRFKLVQKAGYKVASCNYFLGRSYQEKNKHLEAKKYFDLYLASGESDYLDETHYCLALMSDQIIETKPLSLIRKSRELLAYKIDKEFFDQEILDKIAALVAICKNQNINSKKALDLGSNLGFLGKLLKTNLKVDYLKGKDLGEELIKFTSLLKDDKKLPYYNDLSLSTDFHDLFEENILYDLVVISDLMDYYSNVSEIMMEGQSLLDKGGYLLIAFRQDDSAFSYSHKLDQELNLSPLKGEKTILENHKTFNFIKELEAFSFNPSYVKSFAEKMGFIVKISLQINHFTLFLLHKC
jgi:predicted TPR repeat methyltransferase